MANLPENPLWEQGIYQLEITDPVMGGADGVDNKQAKQLANRTAFLKQQVELLKAQDSNSPIGYGYSATTHYRPATIIWTPDSDSNPFIGAYYECYHRDGCIGKDPRDPANRSDGWTNADPTKPYYWLKIGKWLELPPIGSPFPMQKVQVPSNYIKYRGDGNLHKDKYWRLAEVFPDLITSNIITIADLRSQVTVGYDDGRGIDQNRQIGSSRAATVINKRIGLDHAHGYVLDIANAKLANRIPASATGWAEAGAAGVLSTYGYSDFYKVNVDDVAMMMMTRY